MNLLILLYHIGSKNEFSKTSTNSHFKKTNLDRRFLTIVLLDIFPKTNLKGKTLPDKKKSTYLSGCSPPWTRGTCPCRGRWRWPWRWCWVSRAGREQHPFGLPAISVPKKWKILENWKSKGKIQIEGQIVSKANFEDFIWTKNGTKIFLYFCSRSLKWIKSKRNTNFHIRW